MGNILKLPVGIDDFKKLREAGFYYIDKTGLIQQLLQNWGEVNLFTRPRRFGKTLNMSMLKNFFEIGADSTLFDGLYISQNEKMCEEYMGKYPVVFLSLKGVDGLNFEDAKDNFRQLIGNEAERFSFLRNSEKLSENEKKKYQSLVSLNGGRYTMNGSELTFSLQTLSQLLYRHYGQKTVILIDDRRIEIYWGEQMRRADNENDYLVKYKGEVQELVHWTSDMTWDYGTVYQKESMRTTLSLVHPVDPECAGEVTVQVVGKLTDVKDRPADNEKVYQTVYQPYYVVRKKGTSGIVVKAGEKTTPAVVDKALAIIDMMLEKIPEVAEELVRRGAEVSVFGLLENAYDVPEHRMGYLLATRHVAGYGGEMTNPASSISEANVIRLRTGRYATSYPNEMILVHEFGHAIHLVGMNGLKDQTLADMIRKAYQHASDNGLWPDTYAISNYEEYFATLSTVWFNVMQEGVDGRWDGIRGPVNTREELKTYDPEGYELMKHIYPEKTLPEPWHYNVNIYDIDGKPYKSYDENMKFNWDFIQ